MVRVPSPYSRPQATSVACTVQPPTLSRRTAQPHWAGIEGRGKRGVVTRRGDAGERRLRAGPVIGAAVRAGATSGAYGQPGGFRGGAGR